MLSKEYRSSNTNIPEKVIGVSKPQDHSACNLFKDYPITNFNEPMTIVDDLEKHFKIHITGKSREILEDIARGNMMGLGISNLDIADHLKKWGLNHEYIRKLTRKLESAGLLKRLSARKGHELEYVLVNMLDRLSDNKGCDSARKDNELEGQVDDQDRNIVDMLYTLTKSKQNAEFHHISLRSRLKHPDEDYKKFRLSPTVQWYLSSDKNRCLIHERRVSLHRSFTIEVYPNGTVMMMVRCSKEPYKWNSRDDWINLMSTCGAIHQTIKDSLTVSSPLVHSIEGDWFVTQLHVGYDYKIGGAQGKLNLLRLWNGALKVKHLDGVYQLYNKQLPYRGQVLRIEEQLNFSSDKLVMATEYSTEHHQDVRSQPILSSINKDIKPKSAIEILDNIFS
ncbi:MAG: hypothetical protein R2685_12865 [Candidatus Nitrosocosmicus sp.]|nr:hypothetical protein [Candidatus Nitrosocosmicus sp.]